MKKIITRVAVVSVFAAGAVQIAFFARDYQKAVAAYEQILIDRGTVSTAGAVGGLPTWD